jgi:hypothetical protein
MTLPWVRQLWREHQRGKAVDQITALNSAALGSAAKYGGKPERAMRQQINELMRFIDQKD